MKVKELLRKLETLNEDREVFATIYDYENHKQKAREFYETSEILTLMEVEYSCSPGGEDRWEIYSQNDFIAGDFPTATGAFDYLLKQYAGKKIHLTIKSLEWYHNNEREEN